MTDSATYLYAITSDAGAAAGELTGVAGTDVRALSQSGLRAYVSTVPLKQFGEAAMRRNLEDLAWVEATARAHHEVVEQVARTTPTAPVRLVTVYRDDAHVRYMLDQRAGEFKEVLAKIGGRAEWGVKVYAASSVAESPGEAEREGGSPGAVYLQRRRNSLRNREEAQRRALSQAERIDSALASIAAATRRHRPQDPQLSGRNEWMVLNSAYLVDEDRGAEFGAAIESLRTREVDVQVTGPWAPYSFAILEAPADRPPADGAPAEDDSRV